MAQSESIAKLATALCEAQFELEEAKKTKSNPHFKTRYADLGAIWDACRGALHKHGLSVVQAPEPSESGIRLRTVLVHVSGEWIDSTLTLPAVKQDPQAYGSAMTYARRYGLAALIGIVADEDDDGNAASQPAQQARNGGASYQPPAQPQRAAQPAQQQSANGAQEPPGKERYVSRIRALWAEERKLGGETPQKELTTDLEALNDDQLIALGKRIAARVQALKTQAPPRAA